MLFSCFFLVFIQNEKEQTQQTDHAPEKPAPKASDVDKQQKKKDKAEDIRRLAREGKLQEIEDRYGGNAKAKAIKWIVKQAQKWKAQISKIATAKATAKANKIKSTALLGSLMKTAEDQEVSLI